MAVTRLNVTHMNVSWMALSLEKARGFITGYTVTYESLALRQRKEAMMEYVQPAEGSFKVIGGLSFTTSYSVTVSARTTAGEGISNSAILVDGRSTTCT